MLYEINQEVEILLNKYEALFDEDWVLIWTDEELETIQKQLEEKQNKVDELKTWALQKRANTLASINSIDLEIERLSKLKESQNKKLDNTNNFLKHLFWKLDKPIIFDNWKIWYRKSETTVIENKDLLPSKFKIIEVKEVEKIPLAEIKKAIESGEEVPWAIIQENLKFYIK